MGIQKMLAQNVCVKLSFATSNSDVDVLHYCMLTELPSVQRN